MQLTGAQALVKSLEMCDVEVMFALCEQKINFLLPCGHQGGNRGGQRGGHLGVTWGSLAIKIPKMSKKIIAETSAKKCVRKEATSLHGDPLQPSKRVFRVHKTTAFTNATRPSKVTKLILLKKADLLELILAPEVWTWGRIGLIG